jgi:hypothetical protein
MGLHGLLQVELYLAFTPLSYISMAGRRIISNFRCRKPNSPKENCDMAAGRDAGHSILFAIFVSFSKLFNNTFSIKKM